MVYTKDKKIGTRRYKKVEHFLFTRGFIYDQFGDIYYRRWRNGKLDKITPLMVADIAYRAINDFPDDFFRLARKQPLAERDINRTPLYGK